MSNNIQADIELRRAKDLHNKILNETFAVEKSYLNLGEYFREMIACKRYKNLGFKTFFEYIKTPELKHRYKRSTVYALIAVYEKYVLQLQYPKERILSIAWKRLHSLNTYINNENKDEVLKIAEDLNAKEFEKQIKKYRYKQVKSYREFGKPINIEGLRYAPTCELGVIYLFGILAKSLGFYVESISNRGIDCIAKMNMPDNKVNEVKIEFEHKAKDFLSHDHTIEDIDIIVCWENNWKDCKKTVISLRDELKKLKVEET